MTLRAGILSDVDSVFLNTGDFAENIAFDGVAMKAVVDTPEASGHKTESKRYEGTFRRSLILHIPSLASPPPINTRVTLLREGEDAPTRWTLRGNITEGGMSRLILEEVDS